MLALYAKVYGISNADAYREICEALQTGDYGPEYQSYQNRQPQEITQSARAPPAGNPSDAFDAVFHAVADAEAPCASA